MYKVWKFTNCGWSCIQTFDSRDAAVNKARQEHYGNGVVYPSTEVRDQLGRVVDRFDFDDRWDE